MPNRRKAKEEVSRSSGLSLPIETYDKIEKYMDDSRYRGSRSEFIRGLINGVIDEWEKEKEVKQLTESANKDTYNSPLGPAMMSVQVQKNSETAIKEKHHDKPRSDMIERLYIEPINEIIKCNMDDPVYMKELFKVLEKQYFHVKGLVTYQEKEAMKNDAIMKALESDRLRRSELSNSEKQAGK